MYPELNNKIAVISGAGGGLGSAVVRRFRNEGVRMVLIDAAPTGLERLQQELALDANAARLGVIDLTDGSAVDAFIVETASTFGPPDILVNVAGTFQMGGSVHENDDRLWDTLYNINVKTAFHLSASVVRQMVTRGRGGRIVSVAARPALAGVPGIAAYSASKAALLRMVESMAAELLDKGITVNAVLPSTIDTPANRKSMPQADFTKWVAPDSLADVIAFLASDASRDISGAAIPVYG